jgi:hypothetical protein
MGYAIRAMSFAEILGSGLRVVREHARLLIGTAALLYVPMAVLDSLAFTPAGMPSWPLWVTSAVVRMVVGPFVFCAITFAVGELYLGRPTSIGPSLRAGLAIFGPMQGTLLIYYALLGLAAVASSCRRSISCSPGPSSGRSCCSKGGSALLPSAARAS